MEGTKENGQGQIYVEEKTKANGKIFTHAVCCESHYGLTCFCDSTFKVFSEYYL